MITWGHNCQQGGPHALTGGPSVQVQFPHLKISTLTTATATLRISVTYLAYIAETYSRVTVFGLPFDDNCMNMLKL